jgi:Na+-driven multidrug efflux pump
MTMTLFPAINKGRPAAFLGIVRQIVFYVPVMLLLPRLFGVDWVYLGSLMIDICIVFMALILVSKEFRRLKNPVIQAV